MSNKAYLGLSSSLTSEDLGSYKWLTKHLGSSIFGFFSLLTIVPSCMSPFQHLVQHLSIFQDWASPFSPSRFQPNAHSPFPRKLPAVTHVPLFKLHAKWHLDSTSLLEKIPQKSNCILLNNVTSLKGNKIIVELNF